MGRRRLLFILACFLVAVFVSGRQWLRSHGFTVGEFVGELRRGDEPRFTWRSIEKKHWQADSTRPTETPTQSDAREGNSRGCPAGMVRVKGAFRNEANGTSTGFVERLQDGACTDWISKEFPARCRTFDKAKMDGELAKVPTLDLDFCIDRFEYPNVFGQNPMIVATFHEAEALCKKESKRLCNENEWTFACEGEEARPYPYGYTRDETACVMDRSWRPFTEGALQPRDGNQARDELDRLWQGEPSGSRPTCKSPFGVYDLTGNVDEWTRSVNPTGYRSILKGGYWGPVRARCRPSTRAHNEDFVAYQQSLRCCSEARENGDAGVSEEPDAGVDAGTPTVKAPAPDLQVEHSQDDELDAIQKDRTIHCSTSFAPASSSTWSLLAAFGLIAIARRRGRSSAARETRRVDRSKSHDLRLG